MNDQICLLADTAQKKEKIILGLMSGTSMDGLDLALCHVKGSGTDTDIELLAFKTVSYPLKLGKQLEDVVSVSNCNLEEICLMHTYLGDFTAQTILDTLDEWDWSPSAIDCIASHGQTIYHAPESKHQKKKFPHTTLQIGDADHIAWETGILTISDFRQKHTAAGGEGAPMAALIDQMLFGDSNTDRILLNIGGIANLTYIPFSPALDAISADTGPGNTLLDAAARQLLGHAFDKNGSTAKQGMVNLPLLKTLKSHAYFTQELPKTTGPELFNWEYVSQAQRQAEAIDIQAENLLATLVQFTADTIADVVKKIYSSDQLEILASGGGIHNTFLMECLEEQLSEVEFVSFEERYFNPDAKEAVCFAILANETLSGEGFDLKVLEETKKVNFGKVSFPK